MPNKILPDLDFKPVISPFTRLPVEEYKEARGILDANYDTTLENLDLFEKSRAALRPADIDEDIEAFNELTGRFDTQFTGLDRREDLENVMTDAKRLVSDFTTAAIPFEQRRQEFQKITDRLQTTKNIGEQKRLLAAAKKIAEGTLTRTDDGRYLNTLSSSSFAPLFTEEANIQEILFNQIKGIKPDTKVSQWLDQMDLSQGIVADVMREKTVQELTEPEIERISKAIIESNIDIQNFRQKEEFFGGLGETGEVDEFGEPILFENRFQRLAEQAILAAQDEFAFRSEDRGLQVLNKFDSSVGRGGGFGDSLSDALVLSSDSPPIQVSSPEQYKDISKTIQRLETSNNPEDKETAKKLKNIQRHFSTQALKEMNDKDRKIYDSFSHYDINEMNQVYSAFSGGRLGRVGSIEQDERYNEDVKSLLKSNGFEFNNEFQPDDLINILNKGNKLIERTIANVTPLAREYTTYFGLSAGKRSGWTGSYNEILNRNKSLADLSVIESFTTNNNKSWKDFFNENYSEVEGYENVTWELAGQNGVTLDGNPMTTVVIKGKNENSGTIEEIEHRNVTFGKEGWNNRRELAISLNKDGRGNEALVIFNGTKILNDGERVAEKVAKANIIGMPDGSEQELNLGNGKILIIEKTKEGNIYLKDPSKIDLQSITPQKSYLHNLQGQLVNFANDDEALINTLADNYARN